MLKIENVDVVGWEATVRGMRNPMNSWHKIDSGICSKVACHTCCENRNNCKTNIENRNYVIGQNDWNLMKRLAKGNGDDRKFMRMIVIYADITAPLYWWKEFDTYKVGTVANSCSTMHKIHSNRFTIDDFSHEHLDKRGIEMLENTVETLNYYRDMYLCYDPNEFESEGNLSKKQIWWQLIQNLPSSYNQKRTVMLNYEVSHNMYAGRRHHKLDEWHTFADWLECLPHSELITGKLDD